MARGTKSQLERSALLFSHFFGCSVTSPRKQVVLNVGAIHQIAEAGVMTLYSGFILISRVVNTIVSPKLVLSSKT